MKKFFQFLVPLLLVILIITSIGWYLFVYDRAFTRDMLLQQARYHDMQGNTRFSSWFYNLAYMYSGKDENVAIELANQYKAAGNYTKAEVTLTNALRMHSTAELYTALCKTYVEQDKLLDAVNLLANIPDPAIRQALEDARPTAPMPDQPSGFYTQYIHVSLSSSYGTLYCTTDGEYPSIMDAPYSEPIVLPLGESKLYCISVAENGLVSPVSILGYTVGGVVETVQFTDAAMEEAARVLLGFDANKTIYTSDLWTITEFTIPEQAASLEDLAHFSYLERLTIPARTLDSLEIIASLRRLQYLDMSGCRFPADALSTLVGLPDLAQLILSDCNLSTIAPLTGAPRLQVLDLSKNAIRNLEPLSDISTLTELHLQHNALTALDALAPLSNLKQLDASFNSLTTIRPLASCGSLTILNVSNNQLTDAEGTSAMPLLEELYLDYNGLTSVETLGGCTNLTKLSISNNRVADLAPLSGLSQLSVFDFSYNSATALPSWPAGSAIRILDGSYNQISSIDSLKDMPNICYIYMDYNALTNIDALAGCFNLVQVNVFGNKIESVSELTAHDIIVNYDPTNSD